MVSGRRPAEQRGGSGDGASGGPTLFGLPLSHSTAHGRRLEQEAIMRDAGRHRVVDGFWGSAHIKPRQL